MKRKTRELNVKLFLGNVTLLFLKKKELPPKVLAVFFSKFLLVTV
jgi:hypothetical protein